MYTNKQSDEGAQKLAYSSPELKALGTVSEMTLASNVPFDGEDNDGYATAQS